MGTAGEQGEELLRRHGLRVTAQRVAILAAFAGRRSEHLTAEEVVERARGVLPDLARATVYATLGEFVRLGVLGSVGRAEPVRYETNAAEHQHFACARCGRLYDVDLPATDASPLAEEGFVVERAWVRLTGTCAACVAFAEGMHAGVAEIRARGGCPAPGRCTELPSPFGPLLVAAGPRGITRVAFAEHADAARLRAAAGPPDGPLAEVRRRFEAYFDGRAPDVGLDVDWDAVAPAAAPFLAAVRAIPHGEEAGYAHLHPESDRPGTGCACGLALGGNPLPFVIPCHRVVRGPGEPVDYTGGLERKHALMAFERAGARGG